MNEFKFSRCEKKTLVEYRCCADGRWSTCDYYKKVRKAGNYDCKYLSWGYSDRRTCTNQDARGAQND
jgi:hypothetical protein